MYYFVRKVKTRKRVKSLSHFRIIRVRFLQFLRCIYRAFIYFIYFKF